MDEDRFRRCSSKTARRRLRSLLVLARDYLKYLFTNQRRLLHKVARRTHGVLSSYHGESNKRLPPYCPPRALMEHEFSCSSSPSPAFLAAKRLQSRLKRGAAAGAAVSSCFGATVGASYGSPPATEEDDVVEEEDEADGWGCYELEPDVDYRAEEFISMFYEQLRAQNFPPVLQRSP